ncbi:MAG: adenylate/guanylate cyclase domain-containing protein [Desulfobaccales bacterium]|nr:adenylate/guanylate cyclase domain-containing protein [Desulfobaccales bacterium]
MFALKSLQQRLALYLLLPVALFLVVTGGLGFFYIRKSLLKEWQEIAILRLERAAHQMDMRLYLLIQGMGALAQTGSDPQGAVIREWILKQIQRQEGVTQARLTWKAPASKEIAGRPGMSVRKVARVSPPQYFYPPGQKTVGLRSDLLDEAGHSLGQVEVVIKFSYLMQDVLTSGWLQSHMACVVEADRGNFLAHSDPSMKGRHCLGDTQSPLELAMLEAMKEKPFGTLMGKGHPPEEVVGYYRLHAAPWAIMLHAQGSQILAPIVHFRYYYLLSAILCLVVILVLIRLGVTSMVFSIRKISLKAQKVAQGHYGDPLPVASQDEIGQLTRSFNEMVEGLKQRDFISNTFGRYVDPKIAQDLLSRPEAALLGGEKRDVVILFADIRDFTPLAEKLSPEATIHLVNRFFSRMIEILQQHRGIIVDFLGDAILAFFDPLDGPLAPTARQALECALKMQQTIKEVNVPEGGWELPPLHMGIGLHAGEVVVGNIGSESRAKYGIIGAAVNLAHRIQAQARGGEVVVSDSVYRQVQHEVVVKREFQPRLKGIQEPITLYGVENLADMP